MLGDLRRLLLWNAVFAPMAVGWMIPTTLWWIATYRRRPHWDRFDDRIYMITASAANRLLALDRKLFPA